MSDKKQPPPRFPDHRGLATWGERLVPLEQFAAEAAAHGRELDASARADELSSFLARPSDATPVEGPYERIAVFGGIYSNHLALAALLEDATRRGAEAIYCLGDFGGFGPVPERIHPLLLEGRVRSIQGNYEQSLAAGEDDCNCGYTDPRDNHFATISYDYTASHCSDAFKKMMGSLPARRRVNLGGHELLLVHGSPRRVNEFLFDSTASDAFLERLLEVEQAAATLCTHSGLQWSRRLPSGRQVTNVGVIGRPANDGATHVWYSMVEAGDDAPRFSALPLEYDHQTLAQEMRSEALPDEFVETILSGWWTTCLEILPAKERAASRY